MHFPVDLPGASRYVGILAMEVEVLDDVAALTVAGVRAPHPSPFAMAHASADPPIYLDCSDLVAHFGASPFPTGIQRVQIELFKASLAWPGPRSIRACAYEPSLAWWVELDTGGFEALCRLATASGRAQDKDWRPAVQHFTEALREGSRLAFPRGAVLINVGSSWWIEDYMSMIREAKAQSGLHYVPLMYDMIPLVLPEYVADGMPNVFAAWAGSVFMHADVVAVISESTARDVQRFASMLQPLAQTPVVLPLDAEFGGGPTPPAEAERTPVLEHHGLRRSGFVLFVGTLEARKNHLLVFQGWARLIEQGHDPPMLVCVGKKGWKFEAAQSFLDAHPDLADKVLVLSGVPDRELYTLYSDCLFTVYSSHYEGWGLPVTESLCHGKVCLTADHSSLPEAGGRFAAYFEADSVRSFSAQALRLISDDAARGEREALIAAEYHPRRWPAVLAGLIEGVTTRLASSAGPGPAVAPVRFGTQYRMTRPESRAFPDRATVVAEMMRTSGDWYSPEGWGLWSRRRRVRLRFSLPAGRETGDVYLYLELIGPVRPVFINVWVGTCRVARLELPDRRRVVRVTVPGESLDEFETTPGRVTALVIEAERLTPLAEYNAADGRTVGFGFCAMTICPARDLVRRLPVLERLLVS